MRHSASHIKTARLWLREIDESDTETIVRLRSDPDVYRYFRNRCKLTDNGHLSWYRNIYVDDGNRVNWIAIDDKNGEVIGLYGVKRYGDEVEISYLTSTEARGKFYAAEAVNAMMQWIGHLWKPKLFTAKIHKDNRLSIKFIESNGFVPDVRDGCFIRYVKVCQ